MDYVQVVVEFALPIVSTLLVAVLTPLAIWLGRKLAAKATVEEQRQLDALLSAIVVQGIHFAEERARQSLQRGDRSTGARKLQDALHYVRQRLDESGIVGIGARRLQDIIEAKLNYERPEMEYLSTSEPVAGGAAG